MSTWIVEPKGIGSFNVVDENKMTVCTVINGETRTSREQTAKLIAAAPELLAVCLAIATASDTNTLLGQAIAKATE